MTGIFSGQSTNTNSAKTNAPSSNSIGGFLNNLLKPKKFGGPAVRPDVAFQVADQLGRGDGSAAWVWSVMTIHDLFVALYPETFQQEYWGKDRTLSTSSFPPCGKAAPEKAGFRVSGKWPFCSGVDNADWLFLGTIFGPPSGGSGAMMRCNRRCCRRTAAQSAVRGGGAQPP